MANKKTGDIEIGGRLFNTATGNIVAGADAIKDEAQGKTQAEINVETYEHVADINAALQELSPDQTEALALATDVNDLKNNVVRSDEQTLTDAQKAQVLANVGINGIDDEPTAGSDNLVKSGGVVSWGEDMYGSYIENPEFIYVATDAADRILWAIRTDGTIHYGAGVPPQVIEYVEGKIAELSLDEYEAIVSFLGSLITGDKTLATLLGEKANATETTNALATKVDKEEGKSLIPTQYIQEVENPEFVAVYTDSEDKILFAIRTDADFYFGYGVPSQIVEYVTNYIQANVLSGSDTTTIDGLQKITAFLDGFTTSETLKHYLNDTYGEYVENPEYVDVKLDSEDKVLEGIRVDGTKVIGGNLEVGGSITYGGKDLDTELETLDYAKVDKIEGKGLSTNDYTNDEKTVVNTTELIEDPEGRLEIKTDSEDKIISYRDEDGVLHENVGIETTQIDTQVFNAEEVNIGGGNATLNEANIDSLNLTERGMTDFQQALKDSGFKPGGAGDFSDSSEIIIPKPKGVAIVNLKITQFPSSEPLEGEIEYYDIGGNYFKKSIEEVGIQGQTTASLAKKSLKFDFADCKVKIGDWVTQDSFHLKAQYIDIFRGKSNLAYNYWREILQFNHSDAFTKPYLRGKDYGWYYGEDNFSGDFSEARLTPDGFPIELYLNGTFYGIYTWNLKKDKDNYAMKKSKTNNIQLDPSYFTNFLNGTSLVWTNVEIRNPKPKRSSDGWELTTVNNEKYDGDHPTELIGANSTGYDSENVSHVKTNEVKQHIIDFFNACAALKANPSKAVFEQYFEPAWFIDLLIYANVVMDGDSLWRNTQYLYWGGKWFVAPYDCDQIFGLGWKGNFVYRKSQRIVNSSIIGSNYEVFKQIFALYETEIKSRYKELRDAGIISSEHWMNILKGYTNNIGKDLYEKELDKWNLTPCYRTPNDAPEWEFTGDYYEGSAPSEWDINTSYTAGDYVKVTTPDGTYYWICKTDCQGVQPYTTYFTDGTLVGGFYDSLTRTEKWLEERIEFLDNYFEYE